MIYMSEKAMSPKTKLFRYLALAGNLLLLFWVVAWQMTLSPHPHLSNVTLAIAWAIPLLLPLPGILAGKPYTHAWANFQWQTVIVKHERLWLRHQGNCIALRYCNLKTRLCLKHP